MKVISCPRYQITCLCIYGFICVSLQKRAHALYSDLFSGVKIEKFIEKNENFNICVQNIDCGCTLEPPRQGGANEYPQAMFWIANTKSSIPPHSSVVLYIKVGLNGIFNIACFPDGLCF